MTSTEPGDRGGVPNLSAIIGFGINIMLMYVFKLARFSQQIVTQHCSYFVCIKNTIIIKKTSDIYLWSWMAFFGELSTLTLAGPGPGLDKKGLKLQQLVWGGGERALWQGPALYGSPPWITQCEREHAGYSTTEADMFDGHVLLPKVKRVCSSQ